MNSSEKHTLDNFTYIESNTEQSSHLPNTEIISSCPKLATKAISNANMKKVLKNSSLLVSMVPKVKQTTRNFSSFHF